MLNRRTVAAGRLALRLQVREDGPKVMEYRAGRPFGILALLLSLGV